MADTLKQKLIFKMRSFLTLFFSLSICYSIGQNLFNNQSPFPSDTSNKNKVYHFSNIHFGSTHFKLALPLKFYTGGFITNDNKGKATPFDRTNISGGIIDLNVGGIIFNKNKLIDGWYVNVNWLQSTALKYPQGLFNAIMYGNSNIENTINLSNLSGHLRNHHKLSFGFFKSNWTYGLTVGSINKEITGNFNTNSSILFLPPYEWNIQLNGNINSTNISTNSFSSNGISIGGDIIYKSTFNEKWNFSIGLNNFGLISFNKNNPIYSIDTALNFTGFQWEELRNIDSSIANYTSSFDTTYAKNYTVITPFTIAANSQFKLKSIFIYSNLKYIHMSQGNYSLSIGGYKKINNNILIGSGINYHSISTFQWEFFTYYQKEKANIGIKLNNLIGIIPNIGKSFGLQTYISWRL